MNDVPLIYTTKGNIPVADLKEVVSWEATDDYILCKIEYFLNDECVKSGGHMYWKHSFDSLSSTPI